MPPIFFARYASPPTLPPLRLRCVHGLPQSPPGARRLRFILPRRPTARFLPLPVAASRERLVIRPVPVVGVAIAVSSLTRVR